MCCIINTIMDKSSTEYEDQGDWSDYEESEEISVYTDTETNASEILPRNAKTCVSCTVFHY